MELETTEQMGQNYQLQVKTISEQLFSSALHFSIVLVVSTDFHYVHQTKWFC